MSNKVKFNERISFSHSLRIIKNSPKLRRACMFFKMVLKFFDPNRINLRAFRFYICALFYCPLLAFFSFLFLLHCKQGFPWDEKVRILDKQEHIFCPFFSPSKKEHRLVCCFYNNSFKIK